MRGTFYGKGAVTIATQSASGPLALEGEATMKHPFRCAAAEIENDHLFRNRFLHLALDRGKPADIDQSHTASALRSG